jgi:hypothetical protein
MGVCLGIYFNVFTLTHAFGFDSLRFEWNALIVFVCSLTFGLKIGSIEPKTVAKIFCLKIYKIVLREERGLTFTLSEVAFTTPPGFFDLSTFGLTDADEAVDE